MSENAPEAIATAAAHLRDVIDNAQVVVGLRGRLYSAARRLESAALDELDPTVPDSRVAVVWTAAAAAERERCAALAEAWEAAYEKPCDKPGHLHTLTTPFADLLRAPGA